MLAEGRRGDAAEYFMVNVVGMPAGFVASARDEPWWGGTEALAHTLPYDATVMGDYSLPTERAASVVPPTMVLAGGADFPIMLETAHALADAIPNGQVRLLEGQGHNVDMTVLAPALKEFFVRWRAEAGAQRSAGGMFWLRWKTLAGSTSALIRARRSHVGPG
jgi:pimeloyl-ACP methyl ester carboxylesterase